MFWLRSLPHRIGRPRRNQRHRVQQAVRREARLRRRPQHLHLLPDVGRRRLSAPLPQSTTTIRHLPTIAMDIGRKNSARSPLSIDILSSSSSSSNYISTDWQPQFRLLARVERAQERLVHLRGFHADRRHGRQGWPSTISNSLTFKHLYYVN